MQFRPAISRRGAVTPSTIRKKVMTVVYLDGDRQRVASKWSDAPGAPGAIWAVRLDGPPEERRNFIKLRRGRARDGGTAWIPDDSFPQQPDAG